MYSYIPSRRRIGKTSVSQGWRGGGPQASFLAFFPHNFTWTFARSCLSVEGITLRLTPGRGGLWIYSSSLRLTIYEISRTSVRSSSFRLPHPRYPSLEHHQDGRGRHQDNSGITLDGRVEVPSSLATTPQFHDGASRSGQLSERRGRELLSQVLGAPAASCDSKSMIVENQARDQQRPLHREAMTTRWCGAARENTCFLAVSRQH